MLFELVVILFSFICLLLILMVLIQKGNSSLGLGNIGGSNLMLFGGGGGQDIFQKTTWVFGAIFMGGSLVLSIMKTNQVRGSRYFERNKTVLPRAQKEQPVQQPLPQAPTEN